MLRCATVLPVLVGLLLSPGCGGGGGGGGGGTTVVVLPRSDLISEPSLLDLGDVPPGGQAVIDFTLRNPTAGTITVSDLQVPSGGAFTLTGSAAPIVLGPGDTVLLSLTYNGSAAGVLDAAVNVITTSPAGILTIPVRVETSGEIVVDFGPVATSGGLTPWLEVDLPPNAISLTLEGFAGTADVLNLWDLVGPEGKVYLMAGNGSYVPRSGVEVVTSLIPNTDRPDVQLVPGGGTYRFRFLGTSGQMQVRAIVESREDLLDETGVLDINVWLAPGLAVDAASAAGDPRLQLALEEYDRVLRQAGVSVGAVDYYDLQDPTFDAVTYQEFRALLQTSAAAAELRFNLYFVEEALEPGVGGASATITGPYRNGTVASGVMVSYEGFPILPARWVGDIAGHETGHYLGLYHTAEVTGEPDFMDDTPNCGADGCDPPGNLMHWQFRGPTNTILTEGQGDVIRGHPMVDPLPK